MKTKIVYGENILFDDHFYDYYQYRSLSFNNKGYLQRWVGKGTIYVGREILEHKLNRKLTKNEICDHIDRNKLNYQMDNLRVATRSQSMQNRGKRKNCSSQFIGVSWYKAYNCWEAKVIKNGVTLISAYFNNEIEAAKWRDKRAIECFGEFASLNFP